LNDRFHNNSDATQSARNGYLVTPSDTDRIASRQLHILTDGLLSVVFAGYSDEIEPTIDDAITIDVTAGQIFPWAVRYITTQTTAGVLAVY
jgi:hypothetical protein